MTSVSTVVKYVSSTGEARVCDRFSSWFWPVAVCVVILLATVATVLNIARQRTGGGLVYGLDDPYIHMAMAKNLARHGVWGVNATEFKKAPMPSRVTATT